MTSLAITIGERGDGLAAAMDERFGRAPRFIIVDADSSELLHTIDNAAVETAHGAGTGAAALMAEHGVTAVVAGRFGPQAYRALQALGIEAWMAPAGLTASQALDLYRTGRLERMRMRAYR